MNTKLKALIFITAIFLIVFSSSVYLLSRQIEPEKFNEQITTYIQDVFPDSKVEIGEVNYSFGISLTLSVSGIKILNSLDEKIFETENLEIKVPFRALYLNNGVVDLKFYNNNFYSFKFNKDEEKNEIVLKMPQFLTKNRLNIRLLQNTIKELTQIDSLIFKDVFNSSSVVEIYNNMEQEGKYGIVHLVGELNLISFLKGEDAKIILLGDITKNKIKYLEQLPNIKVTGNGILNLEGKADINVALTSGEIFKLAFHSIYQEGALILRNIISQIHLGSFKPYNKRNKSLNYSKGVLTFNGDFNHQPRENKIDFNLNVEVENLVYSFNSYLELTNKLSMKVTPKKLDIDLNSLVLGGEANTKIEVDFRPNTSLFSYDLDKVSINSHWDSLKVDSKRLRDFIMNEKKNNLFFWDTYPLVDFNIKAKNININNELFDFITSINFKDKNFNINKSILKSGESSLGFSGEGVVSSSKEVVLTLKGNTKKLDLKTHNFLYPTWLSTNLIGSLDSKLDLNYSSISEKENLLLKINGNVLGGSLENFNIGEFYKKAYPEESFPELSKNFSKASLSITSNNLETTFKSTQTYTRRKLLVEGFISSTPQTKSKVDLKFLERNKETYPTTFTGLGPNLNIELKNE